LKLSSSSGRVRIDECVLRPTKNCININFLRGNGGNRNVFSQMPEISNVWLNRQAFAEILGIRL
jgi:hypothetical protein